MIRRMVNRVVTQLPCRSFGSWFAPIPGDDVMDGLRSPGGFEQKELAFVAAVLKNGEVFWDVGANFGLFSVIAAHALGRTGRVIAIEPDLRNRMHLARNIRWNRLSTVNVLPVAIGNEPREVPWQSCSQGAYSGIRVGNVPGELTPTTVWQTTLDTIGRACGDEGLAFIKMDVEGGELDALRGGTEVFARRKPIVLIELSDSRTAPYGYAAASLLDWFDDSGYEAYSFTVAAMKLARHVRSDHYDYENLVLCHRDDTSRIAPWVLA